MNEDTDPSTEPLTPDQRKTLEYMNMDLTLVPNVKKTKRSSLPSSCKFLGDLEKFDDFRSSVEGHYCQQQASYLFNKEFVRQCNIAGAECYRNFSGLNSAT